MTRAAIYLRISKDPTGEGLGVERQERACRELAEQRGWTVVAVHADNDVSAYRRKKRPAYDELLAGVAAGEYDAVLAYAADRFYRHPRDLERFVDTVGAAGTQVATTAGGDVDLSTPDGRAIARVLGALARAESEKKAGRHAAKSRELAERGERNGGGRQAFADPSVVGPMVKRVASGESLSRVAAWANGINGRRWTVGAVRNLVLQPRVAGYRAHAVGSTGGRIGRRYRARLYEGGDDAFPRLCDRDAWLRAIERFGFGVVDGEFRSLLAPGSRTRPSRQEHLLASRIRCECRGPMTYDKSAKGDRYQCHACWNGVPADVAEAWFLDHVPIGTPSSAAEREQAADNLTALRARRDRLLERCFVSGTLPESDFDKQGAKLAERIAAAELNVERLGNPDTPRSAVLHSGMTVTVYRLRHEHARPFRTREVEENDRNHLAGVPKSAWREVTLARLTVAGSAWGWDEDWNWDDYLPPEDTPEALPA